jgi:hypothetical protein
LRKDVKEIHYLKPYEKIEIENVIIETVLAYNLDKPFHPK